MVQYSGFKWMAISILLMVCLPIESDFIFSAPRDMLAKIASSCEAPGANRAFVAFSHSVAFFKVGCSVT
jgi:hypothetical protein